MTKSWQELETIHDFIDSCKEDAAKYAVTLSKQERENVAAAILSLTFSDHFDEWYEKYPIIDEIQALASDLEWSNSSNIDEDWRKLLGYIDELERQVRLSPSK